MLTALSLLAGCATVAPDQDKEAEFHYKLGISSFTEGNLQAAFVQFQKALQIDPDHKEALNSLGLVYLQWGDFDKAKDLFLKAVTIDRDFSDAFNNLGVTYRELGKWQEAIECFRKALLNPVYQYSELALYNLGITYYRTGRFDLAIDNFKDSLKRSPAFSLPYYGMSLAYNKAGRYGDAAAALEQAIKLDTVYKGNRTGFANDIKQKLLSAKGAAETDFRDYLEIMRY